MHVVPIERDGFLSCRDPRCAGYEQRPARILERYHELLFRENGGDSPGVERSWSTYTWLGDTEPMCPFCGGPQIPDPDPRVQYERVSGQAQDELLKINQAGQIQDTQLQMLNEQRVRAEAEAKRAEAEMQERLLQTAAMNRQAEAFEALAAALLARQGAENGGDADSPARARPKAERARQ